MAIGLLTCDVGLMTTNYSKHETVGWQKNRVAMSCINWGLSSIVVKNIGDQIKRQRSYNLGMKLSAYYSIS